VADPNLPIDSRIIALVQSSTRERSSSVIFRAPPLHQQQPQQPQQELRGIS
jgi:hypothetical protein